VRTVAVCDSEPVAIEGLRLLLQEVDGLRIVAAELSLSEAMEAIRALKPCLAVLDKAFGLEAVLDCLRALREGEPGTRPVVWGTSVTSSEAVRLLRAGAAGVVRKTSPLSVLMECLESAAGGGTWIEDGLIAGAEAIMSPVRTPLTGRELQVMELVERGMTNKRIAAELGIRIGTVKIHLRHIFEKTGIRGRYGLALSGLRKAGPALMMM
jgi:DNA-binding NarL/FixJ family response regulator